MTRDCGHRGVKHWEKGEKIRDEIKRDGTKVTWYKWYEVCDMCGQSIRFESREE